MTSARDLALRYDEYVSALWRGDASTAHAFGAWLEARWRGDGPPEPEACPDAISACGGAGKGIRWYETAAGILGYVPGRQGCFQISRAAVPPMVPVLHLTAHAVETATP